MPGLLAQLFGTVQIPRLKICLSLQWAIRDQDGDLLHEHTDFVALGGLTSPELSVTLAPPGARELRLDSLLNPGGDLVCLWLTVTLAIADQTLAFELGPLPFIRLPLLLPSFVALFNEPNFGVTDGSAVLIVVPESSPLSGIEPLFKTLRKLESVTSALRSIGGLAGFFLGLDEVLGAIPDQPRLRFAAANQIDKLGDITIKRRPWYNPLGSDKTFDDATNSILVFGSPGLEVEFFNDTKCKDNTQGWYTVKLNDTVGTGGELLPDVFVAIRTLYADDDVAPPTIPPGRIAAFRRDEHGDDSWDTDLSSLRFSQAYRDAVDNDVKAPPSLPPLVCHPPKHRPPTHAEERRK